MPMLKKSFALILLLAAAPTIASDWSADIETERSARDASKALDAAPGEGPLNDEAARGGPAAADGQHPAAHPGACPCRCVPAHDHRHLGHRPNRGSMPDHTSGG